MLYCGLAPGRDRVRRSAASRSASTSSSFSKPACPFSAMLNLAAQGVTLCMIRVPHQSGGRRGVWDAQSRYAITISVRDDPSSSEEPSVRHGVMRTLIGCGLLASLIVQPRGTVQATRSGQSWVAAPGVVPLTPAQVPALRRDATSRVIVVLRPATQAQTTQAWSAARDVLRHELGLVARGRVTPLPLIDAFAATISPQEAARLAADPRVLEVAPDRPIRPRSMSDPRTPQAIYAIAT